MSKNIQIIHGDCVRELLKLSSSSVDALVTDPPAGISFMGKDWDGDKGGRDAWIAWMSEVMTEAMRVLKPGAHGLVWALPRTSHWTATALENAGFEVRDVVTHLFGTGFPKSLDISKAIDKAASAEREVLGRDPNQAGHKKNTGIVAGQSQYDRSAEERVAYLTAPSTDAAKQWQGWGTALKPASEHWILVRKPCSEKTVAANVLKHGTGGINIDASRIGLAEGEANPSIARYNSTPQKGANGWEHANRGANFDKNTAASMNLGRFPANLILDEDAAAALDEQSGLNCGAAAPVRKKPTPTTTNVENIKPHSLVGDNGKSFRGDTGGASRFFYVAKASKSDKGEGNSHPTVKSTALMTYLIKLITPPDGVVLDPFMGSGSSGVAAVAAGFGFTGIEKEKDYFLISKKRLQSASKAS